MFEQQAPDKAGMMAHPLAQPDDGPILDWIAGWTPVREEVMRLFDAYATADGGHDISSFAPLIDQLDATMRLLQHRVHWIGSYLGHGAHPGNKRN